jgi:predicted DsbA family dithiol-disulfide isomerase
LQRSLQNWTGEPVTVEYRSFFLNPSIPPEGYDFIPYMQAKFNGRISLEQAFEAPRRMGESIGLTFNMEKIQKAPNSTLSHCLIALAPEDKRDEVIEAVYAAYFERGQDIGDLEVLVSIGNMLGMDAGQLRVQLGAEEVRKQVEAEAQQSLQMGIRGVPVFIVNGKYAFSGAQQPEVITNVLHEVQERGKGEVK